MEKNNSLQQLVVPERRRSLKSVKFIGEDAFGPDQQ